MRSDSEAEATVTWQVLSQLRRSAGASSGAILALVLLSAVNIALTPHFATTGNLWNILVQVSPVVLVSIGMTFVIGTGGVDLSVGSVMAVAAAMTATQLEHGIIIAVAAGLGAALVIALLNGVLVARYGIQSIVVTLGTLIGGRGLAQVLSNDGQLIPINNAAFVSLGRGAVGPIPAAVVVAVIAILMGVVVLRSTPLGRYVLAVGGNPVAATLAGVPVRRTLMAVYAMSGLLAGVAGMIVASRLASSDGATIGLNMELDAIAATVVGGTSLVGGRATVLGTVIGVLVMQVIATSFNMLLIPYAWSLVLKAAIILLAVYMQRTRRA